MLGQSATPLPSERAFRSSNEKLYEAYNDLHALAQDFEKPFDAPAILVVGHQTGGKSALVEALMGFQFNHVGGGTKTRRPIALHMKYDGSCAQPRCYAVNEEFGETALSLEEMRAHIEAENTRLEREGAFWAKEMVFKIEYKFCPNLTIIDTPGLHSAAPGRRHAEAQASARAVEAMVRSKMEQREYILLCLEDCNDWADATTRRLVMQSDPALARTVLVSTKLDTRVPQFAGAADVEAFLRPPSRLVEPSVLGGAPFFTSVPSGRVGEGPASGLPTDQHFRDALAEREAFDVAELESRLSRRLCQSERARVGVGQLRRFLEQLLQRRYLENVPAIVPALEREHRTAEARLAETQAELRDLHPDRLKDKGRVFREAFLSKLALLLRGTVAAPLDRFGETLADEHVRGGSFLHGSLVLGGLGGGRGSRGGAGLGGATLLSSATFEQGLVSPASKAPLPLALPETSLASPLPPPPLSALPNAHMRLYGGAQYHRAMAEFRLGVGTLRCPEVTREEVVNACGVDDLHDGVNHTRGACVIAVSKAREAMEPTLGALGYRLAHVLRRLLPLAMHLLRRDGRFLNGHDLFLKRLGAAYHAFVDDAERSCRERCLEDLHSLTRYVSWSLHSRGRGGVVAAMGRLGGGAGGLPDEAALEGDATASAVGALVGAVFDSIRDHMVQSVELKFNCFFLMPMLDAFPARLREELEAAYEEDLDDVFDVAAVRAALEQRLKALEAELRQVERLQRKFASIHATLSQPLARRGHGAWRGGGAGPGAGEASAAAGELRRAASAAQAALAEARAPRERRRGERGTAAQPEPVEAPAPEHVLRPTTRALNVPASPSAGKAAEAPKAAKLNAEGLEGEAEVR